MRISDPCDLGSWYIKGTDESVTRVESSVPLMFRDLSYLGSLILIKIPKVQTEDPIQQLKRDIVFFYNFVPVL